MPLRSVIIVVVVVVNAYVFAIRCLSITQKLIRNGTHRLPLQSVLIHFCCPNTSHAKSSTHTEPLLSRWSFSSAQTTYVTLDHKTSHMVNFGNLDVYIHHLKTEQISFPLLYGLLGYNNI